MSDGPSTKGKGVAEDPAGNKCLLESLTVWNAPEGKARFPTRL